MNKFVFLSFVVLGWVFFELSGGSDFKPRVDPALTDTASTLLAAPGLAKPGTDKPEPDKSIAIATTAMTVPTPTSEADADVVTVVEIATAPAGESSETGFPSRIDLAELPDVTLASLGQGGTEFGGLLAGFDPNALALASTVTNVTASKVDSQPEEPVADVRTVSANHVNMRHGPGTTYDVVTRLKLGDEVEVLDDSGTGWLRLRLVSDRTVGWISASLISKPER